MRIADCKRKSFVVECSQELRYFEEILQVLEHKQWTRVVCRVLRSSNMNTDRW